MQLFDILAPSLTIPATVNRRWSPFADVAPSKSPLVNTVGLTSQSSSLKESNVLLDHVSQYDDTPATSVGSFSLLTDAVKSAMNKGQLSAGSNRTRQAIGGTTLSTKDLNHLSPQSM
jgi:hypothetical protein